MLMRVRSVAESASVEFVTPTEALFDMICCTRDATALTPLVRLAGQREANLRGCVRRACDELMKMMMIYEREVTAELNRLREITGNVKASTRL